MKINYEKVESVKWVYYIGKNANSINSDECGKWMYFFDDNSFVADICEKAITENIVVKCKHSNDKNGVSCFYLNISDTEAHKKVIKFFLENNLIKRTKANRLYNISFKLDIQTRAGEYGDDFISKLTLSDFMNLETGEFIK